MLSDFGKPIAFWTPLPPLGSGISDYSFELLASLNKKCAVAAVVDDQYYRRCKPPSGVDMIKASEYSIEKFSTNIFQFGNHFGFHGYMYKPLLTYGGTVVIHDLSLFDFHAVLCGTINSDIFLEELIFDNPQLKNLPHLLESMKDPQTINRLDYPVLRRILNASNAVFVNSEYGCQFIKIRYSIEAEKINYGMSLNQNTLHRRKNSGEKIIFGVFGGISKHKKIPETLKAFIKAREKNQNMKLMIAGRVDDTSVMESLQKTVSDLDDYVRDDIEFHTNLSFEELDHYISLCDVQILLRWPTMGETSATLLRGFYFGKPAIISPLPQWLEYPNEFCWPIENTSDLPEHLASRMLGAANDTTRIIKASLAAQKWAETELDIDYISSRILSRIRSTIMQSQSTVLHDSGLVKPKSAVGVTAITALATSTGIAEAARRSIKALYDSGIEISIADHDLHAPTDEDHLSPELKSLRYGAIFPFNICYLNISECSVLDKSFLYEQRKNNRLLASWWWELPLMPDHLIKLANDLRPDAILVGSNFVKNIFNNILPFPVHVVPPIVEVATDLSTSKQVLNIPEDTLVYLISFDANSPFRRKNPIGGIDAYIKAMPNQITDSVLVVKASHLYKFPEARKIIKQKLASINGILIEEHISPTEMGSLLSLADIYISLHRSEGFGLGMAESMYLGKPVIGTAYSGNTDFLNNSTGCPVGYELVKIQPGDFYLNPTPWYAELHAPKNKPTYWAEPDLDDAVAWIRELAKSESLRQDIGNSGREFMHTNYSQKAHADVMLDIISQYI
ncbi:MAG: glycosyltransferase [Firmicutes bacterium]|nr:glycosyltransferase [Bacillota bacterium]